MQFAAPAASSGHRPGDSASLGLALDIVDLCKSFGPNTVLDRVQLRMQRGEIRALLGLNGSGKSTLIKILAGYHQADRGEVEVAGAPLNVTGRRHSAPPGMRFVHQDLALAAGMSAVDNLSLGAGYPRTRIGTVAWRRARAEARRSLAGLGYDFDPTRLVGELSAVERAGVAIARAMGSVHEEVSLLVLDEPTAALPAHECARLFDAVRRLADRGTAVLYVTHHLEEVFELAHRVSVLRNGRMIDDAPVADRTHDSLVEAMSGSPVVRNQVSVLDNSHRPPTLRVTGLRTKRLKGIGFTAAVGEIVGIAGITGSGRDELAPALMGMTPREGSVQIGDTVIRPRQPRRAVAAGMACIPADRMGDALLPVMSVKENLTIAGLKTVIGGTFIRRRRERRAAMDLISRLAVRPGQPDAPIITLSGGNQQKIVLGRWLAISRAVIVLDEPTQGVDVTSRATVYSELREISKSSAVVVCSSDSDELAQICDRVIILRGGHDVAHLSAPITAADIDVLALESADSGGSSATGSSHR